MKLEIKPIINGSRITIEMENHELAQIPPRLAQEMQHNSRHPPTPAQLVRQIFEVMAFYESAQWLQQIQAAKLSTTEDLDNGHPRIS